RTRSTRKILREREDRRGITSEWSSTFRAFFRVGSSCRPPAPWLGSLKTCATRSKIGRACPVFEIREEIALGEAGRSERPYYEKPAARCRFPTVAAPPPKGGAKRGFRASLRGAEPSRGSELGRNPICSFSIYPGPPSFNLPACLASRAAEAGNALP